MTKDKKGEKSKGKPTPDKGKPTPNKGKPTGGDPPKKKKK